MHRSRNRRALTALGAAGCVAAGAVAAAPAQAAPRSPVISIADASASEGAGVITFSITLDRAAPKRVTGEVRFTSGSARFRTDFTTSERRFSIPRGATSTTVTARLVDDAVDEPDERFTAEIRKVD